MKPYPALTIVPTADICPCDDRKKFIIEDNAVPNSTSRITSSTNSAVSAADRYHPAFARYMNPAPVAIRHMSIVESTVAI